MEARTIRWSVYNCHLPQMFGIRNYVYASDNGQLDLAQLIAFAKANKAYFKDNDEEFVAIQLPHDTEFDVFKPEEILKRTSH
jgi:hypothetical protein